MRTGDETSAVKRGPPRAQRAAGARSARRVRATFEFVELNDYVDWIRGHIVENKLPDESMALVEGLLFLEIHGLRRLRFPSCWRIVSRGSASADGRAPAPWVNRCANAPMALNTASVHAPG